MIIIISDISDHFSQFCVCQPLSAKQKPRKLVTRDYSKFSEERFVDDLSQLNWDSIAFESSYDVNKSFSTFYNKLNRIVNKHAPLKTISKRKAKQLNKPWIKGLVSEETVVLRRWGSETRKFGLSTELIM